MNFSRTVAYIDLAALQYNLSRVKKTVTKSKILAMVKSRAYGHGAIEISKSLKPQVDVLGVACLQEALELYSNKIHTRIVIWGGFLNNNELQTIIKYGFETVIHNFEQIDILEKSKLTKPITVWLKIDTGMHRLGFQPEQAIEAKKRLIENSMVHKPLYYMTHFSDAPTITNAKTHKQTTVFKEVTANWEGENGLANSAAILNWPESYSEWIRPGIILYGISPMDHISGQELGYLPVMTLTSKIIAIQNIKKGESVGYNSTWVAPRDTRIGVIAIGYGDGYPRHIKPGTNVLINRIQCQVIGRVSMDYLTVDLTELSETKVGDQVILWGRGLPVEDIAQQAGTSPYELCCQLTSRVKYTYYQHSNDLEKALDSI
jgi:alanine racemase